MGAGDVKALAALGAWLGPHQTLFLFIYMGICGGVLILAVLGWRGVLWAYMRQGWRFLKKLVLPLSIGLEKAESPPKTPQKIPYGAALALGMTVLFFHGFGY
jgi:prepilin peptidase CpaA